MVIIHDTTKISTLQHLISLSNCLTLSIVEQPKCHRMVYRRRHRQSLHTSFLYDFAGPTLSDVGGQAAPPIFEYPHQHHLVTLVWPVETVLQNWGSCGEQ